MKKSQQIKFRRAIANEGYTSKLTYMMKIITIAE